MVQLARWRARHSDTPSATADCGYSSSTKHFRRGTAGDRHLVDTESARSEANDDAAGHCCVACHGSHGWRHCER